MSKKIIWVVVSFLLMVALVLASCGPAAPGEQEEETTAPVGPTEHQVNMKNFAFQPRELTIKVGDTVTWTEQDSVSHTTTGDIWDSGTLSQGQTHSKTFDKAGTYDYDCSYHPSMKGKVIVE